MRALLALLTLAACTPAADGPTDDTDDTDDTAPRMELTGVSPASATVGAEVVLTGAGFLDDPGDSVVTVGGVEATVVAWFDSEITIEVPDVLPGSRPVVVEVGGASATVAFDVVLPRRAYVVLGTSPVGGVAVLDVADDGVLTEIDGSPFATGAPGDFGFGGVPGNVAVSTSTRRLFVTGIGAVSVLDLDGETGAITAAPGSPVEVGDEDSFGVAVSADGEHLYVTRCSEGDVVHFAVAEDGTLDELGATAIGGCGDALRLTPDGSWMVVSGGDQVFVLEVDPDGSLAVVDGSPFALPESSSYGWALDPLGEHLYAGVYLQDHIAGFDVDGATGALAPMAGSPWSTAAGGAPNGLAFHPNGAVLYASLWERNGLEVFDVADDGSLESRGGVDSLGEPAALEVAADGSVLCVIGQDSGAVQSFVVDANGDLTAAGDPVVFEGTTYPQGLALTGF